MKFCVVRLVSKCQQAHTGIKKKEYKTMAKDKIVRPK